MPGGCGCSGASCGCTITAGAGIVVTGAGTVRNPFVVSSGATASLISQSSSGPLDLSELTGDSIATVAMTANATSVLLPDAPGSRIELVVEMATAGRTITWPSTILWAGGVVPPAGATGSKTWIVLHKTTDYWVGQSIGLVS